MNHISQSRRRWYGANCRGRRIGLPGLPLNSYSCHSVAGVTDSSRGSLDDDLPAHPGDAPERAVRVDQAQRVEGGVHHLVRRQQVGHRAVAEHGDEHGHGDDEDVVPQRRVGRAGRARDDREQAAEDAVAEGRAGRG